MPSPCPSAIQSGASSITCRLYLDLLEAEASQGDWLSANRDTVRAMLEESLAAEARGESYSVEEAEAILATRRAERSAQRAA